MQPIVGSTYLMMAVATYTRLIRAERFGPALDFIKVCNGVDPALPAHMAVTMVRVIELANPTPLLEQFESYELSAEVRYELNTLAGIARSQDAVALEQWFARLDPYAWAELLLVLPDRLADVYFALTGAEVGDPCINPECPVHGVHSGE